MPRFAATSAGVLTGVLGLALVGCGAPVVADHRPGAAAVVVVASAAPTPTAPASNPPGSATPTPVAVPGARTTPLRPQSAGEQVVVSRVVDGDSFELADGRAIRVLGIDSCELNTPGGQQAKSAAAAELTDARVTLTSEPGVDLDPHGRHLRYVRANALDLGEYLVQYDHTGVYQGSNDASDDHLRRLYANDLIHAANPPSGRECGDPSPPAPTTARKASPPAQDEPPAAPSPGCHPSYEPCVPDGPRDLDCKDVGHRVRVVGPDEYRLDGDDDGKGCESY